MKFILFLFAVFSVWQTNAQKSVFTVHAGAYLRENTPVEFKVATNFAEGTYQVRNTKTGKTANADITKDQSIVFILPDILQPGDIAVYSLQKTGTPATKPVKVLQTKAGLSVSVNKKELLYYHIATAMPPADSPAYYARSGFIHPLYSPGGNVLTDDFPDGHAHQHGIMMAWVSTNFRNEDPDFWNQQNKRGNVKHIKLIGVEEGAAVSTIKLQLEHYTEKSGEILSEVWTIKVYPFHNYFLFDIASDQLNTSRDTLFMKKYHYGGMEFRGSREWNADDKDHFTNKWEMRTDSGFTIENGNGRKAAYVTVEGDVTSKHSGVAVFSFPENFRYPQPIRIHPEMPYWCFAPMVDSGFSINPGQHFLSRFRYLVFDGTRNDPQLRNLNNDILHPLKITW